MNKLLTSWPISWIIWHSFHLLWAKRKQLLLFILSVIWAYVLVWVIGYLTLPWTEIWQWIMTVTQEREINLESKYADFGDTQEAEIDLFTDIIWLYGNMFGIIKPYWPIFLILYIVALLGIGIATIVYTKEVLEYSNEKSIKTTLSEKYIFAWRNVFKFVWANIVHWFILVFITTLILALLAWVFFGIPSLIRGTDILNRWVIMLIYIAVYVLIYIAIFLIWPYLYAHGIATWERFITPLTQVFHDMKWRVRHVLWYTCLLVICVFTGVIIASIGIGLVATLMMWLFSLISPILWGIFIFLIFVFMIVCIVWGITNIMISTYIRWRYTNQINDTISREKI